MTKAGNSQVMRTIPLLITIFSLSFPAYAQYSGGMGEPNDPYLIYTAEQMNEIGLHEEDWDKHFKLMADIDLSGYTGTDFNMIAAPKEGVDGGSGRLNEEHFSGVFDGDGHMISNFTYADPNADHVGLFRRVEGNDVEISDVHLTI